MAISLHQFYLDKKPARKVSVSIFVLVEYVFCCLLEISSLTWCCYMNNPYFRLDFIEVTQIFALNL